MSAAQGTYTTTQLALDITQGSRVSTSAYSPQRPPPLSLRARGAGAVVKQWQAALRRAHDAPQVLEPGLLASQIPGGAGYAGITGGSYLDGVSAADRGGRIATLSLGSAATLPARIAALTTRRQLVVADLPAGAGGLSDLRALSATRPADQLEIVVQRAADAPGNELLWVSVGGLGGGHTAELAEHQRARPGPLDRSRTDDPPPPRPARSRRDARQADRARRLLRRRPPALVQSAPARDLRPAAAGAAVPVRRLGAADARRAGAAAPPRARVGGARRRAGAAVDAGGGARAGGVRARPRGRRRAARAALLRPRHAHRPAAAVASRPAGACARGGRGAHRRCARRHAAARTRVARTQPGARRALLRDRQRAQVGARRARLRRRGRRALPGGAGAARGEHDGRLRDRARGDRGLGADRSWGRRRDPRVRRHGRRHGAVATWAASRASAG